MTIVLTTCSGRAIPNPRHEDLVAALSELSGHGICWASDHRGWTVNVSASGRVTLENNEAGEGLWHMTGLSSRQALDLWTLLATGQVDLLRQHDWKSFLPIGEFRIKGHDEYRGGLIMRITPGAKTEEEFRQKDSICMITSKRNFVTISPDGERLLIN